MAELCKCERACMLTAAERYRGRIKCRYRHGKVQPLSYFRLSTLGAEAAGNQTEPPCGAESYPENRRGRTTAGEDSE